MLLLLLEDQTDFVYKVEKFYNPTIKKVNVTIDGTPNKIFKESILPRNMYPEEGICKRFYQNDSDVSLEEYFTTKYGLWIDTRLFTDDKLHGSGRLVNSTIKLQTDKIGESSGNLLCYIFAVQDAYIHQSDGKLDAIDL